MKKKNRHNPNHKRKRDSIRRKHCPFCDGYENIETLMPEFGAYIVGHSLPFRTDLHVSGICGGEMAVTFTWPYKDQMVYAFRGEHLTRPISSIEARMISREVIRPRRQRFMIRIPYCPMCGRKFKNNRQKQWKE